MIQNGSKLSSSSTQNTFTVLRVDKHGYLELCQITTLACIISCIISDLFAKNGYPLCLKVNYILLKSDNCQHTLASL